jgi:hypothetical protein
MTAHGQLTSWEAIMKLTSKKHRSASAVSLFLFTLILTAVAGRPSRANEGILTVPSGTILPVRLNSTISSTKSKPGEEITGRIMQDVPLPSGMMVRAGSKVVGHIAEVVPATSTENARISIQFDKLISSGQTVTINTNLRAIASFMGVIEAQTPTTGPGEGDNFSALNTVQIGGDDAYGFGGPVTSSMNPDDVVGKELKDGMLGQVRAKEGTKCRGALDGNDNAQALWVFSSDACGTYRLGHISIAHAGRTVPVGVIVLSSDKKVLKIPEGAAMLLRVTTFGSKT